MSQSKLSTSSTPPTSSGQDGQEGNIDDGARVNDHGGSLGKKCLDDQRADADKNSQRLRNVRRQFLRKNSLHRQC